MKLSTDKARRMHQQQAFGFYGYVKTTVAGITNPKISESKARFEEAYQDFDVALKPISKTTSTKDLKEEDQRRDNIWRGLKSVIDGAMLNVNPEIASIGARANILLNTYGYAPRQAYTKQTGIVENLISDLYKYLKQAEREQIGIENWIKDLKESNEKFKKLYLERVNYLQLLESGKSQETRKLVDQAYEDLVEIINAVYLLGEPNEQDLLEEPIRKINVLLKRELSLVKRRKSGKDIIDDDEFLSDDPEETEAEPAK